MPKFVKVEEKIVVDQTKEYDQDRLKLTLEIIEASSLPSQKIDIKPSTYVLIECEPFDKKPTLEAILLGKSEKRLVETKFKTKLIKQSHDPIWKERFAVFPQSEKDVLKIQIYDKGYVNADILCASVDIPIESLSLNFREDLEFWILVNPAPNYQKREEDNKDPELRISICAENFGNGSPFLKYDRNDDLLKFAYELLETIKQEKFHFVQNSISMLEDKIQLYEKGPSKRTENTLASFMRGYVLSLEEEGYIFKEKEKCKNLFV